jgi:hypothetical protein
MPVQDADELDPFRGSVISDDEEAVVESQGRTPTHMRGGSGGGGGEGGGGKKKKEVYIYPSAAGDVGHRRIGSAGTTRGGGGVGEDRMMTSAEMNMKSQFLMNLRPFGEESARSEGSGTTSTATASAVGASRLDREGMLSEDEDEPEPEPERKGDDDDDDDEELGPGSDFFR